MQVSFSCGCPVVKVLWGSLVFGIREEERGFEGREERKEGAVFFCKEREREREREREVEARLTKLRTEVNRYNNTDFPLPRPTGRVQSNGVEKEGGARLG